MVNGTFSIPLGNPDSDAGSAGCRSAGASVTQAEFIADAENTLLTTILQPQEIIANGFIPLVFTGPTGVGKSFLATGLVARWSQQDRMAVVASCTGADFCRLFREAIETDAIEEYRSRFRAVNFLVLDDLTELSGKDAAQIELASTIDDLLLHKQIVVVTSRTPPARLNRFVPQLASRLAQGLELPLKLPGPAARHELIRRLASRHSIQLSDESIALLVESGPHSASGLQGALLQMASESAHDSTRLDPGTVIDYLTDRQQQSQFTVNSLAKLVARRFRLRVADLKSSSRRQTIVLARGVAMYLARQHTRLSLERIGEYFGKRDHTTVLHACRQIRLRLEREPELKEAVDDIKNQLKGPFPQKS